MTAGVLLCAGGSTRFAGGDHKLLASFRGRPLVVWALEHAGGAHFDELLVVVGAIDLGEVLDTQIVVENALWPSGQASSLIAGIAEAERRGHQSVVVGLGDQPFVLASAWMAVADSSSPIAVATFDGQRSPPVRLSKSVWPLLPTGGDVGARELMRSRPDLVVEIPCRGRSVDIDTLEDLKLWT